MSIPVDHHRIAMMEKNIADIHRWFDSNGKGKAKILFKHQFKRHYFILPPAYKILWRMRSADKRMLPEFSSTGVIRSGTSSLSNYILQHPCVAMPLSKELGALSPRLNAVKAQFPLIKEGDAIRQKLGHVTTGDCTPMMPGLTQLYWMKAVNPDMKYVITLRNPVARTLSHLQWHNMIADGFKEDPLWSLMPSPETILRDEMQGFSQGSLGYLSLAGAANTGFVRQSLYLPFLKKLFAEVPAQNIHILSAEQMFADPDQVIAEVYQFLGLPDYKPVHIKETNPSKPLAIHSAVKDELAEFFAPHNDNLYNFLGRDFSW